MELCSLADVCKLYRSAKLQTSMSKTVKSIRAISGTIAYVPPVGTTTAEEIPHSLHLTGLAGLQVSRAAQSLSKAINDKRKARGLQPRPVRAVVIGFPNVGKSALINSLLGRRVCDSAPIPGVTRSLRWLKVGGDLDLLDAPGKTSHVASLLGVRTEVNPNSAGGSTLFVQVASA